MCNQVCAPRAAVTAPAPKPAAAFASRLLDINNQAATALMISVGHRTGLFTTMAVGEALTSRGWAERTQLDERYVREWLACMAVARIVELDVAAETYRLPQEHATFLGNGAPGGNMAGMFQFISVLGGVESRIVQCFRSGGGVPYEAFERFHTVMAEESAQTIDVAATVALVDGLAARLDSGIEVVDVGCGLGRALQQLARLYPNSRFQGYDFSSAAIAQAAAEAMQAGLANLTFRVLDAAAMSDTAAFDLAFTFDAVHDQARPDVVLAAIRRALRPDGIYIMQDIHAATPVAGNLEHPLGPFLYAISCMHCMTVSLAGGGAGLGAAWGEQLARRMLADAGFSEVQLHLLPHDVQNAYYVCR